MPISAIDGLSEQHWLEVREILTTSVNEVGFDVRLVSEADESGIIHSRIVQNLFDNPVVVVDVSGKNPNVMFELGMRLTFDRPAVVVKDDQTTYSFDSSPIEHLTYPRDLRYTKIQEFKTALASKVSATHQRASEPNYSSFLKHFGTFVPKKLDSTEIPSGEFIFRELSELRRIITRREAVTGPGFSVVIASVFVAVSGWLCDAPTGFDGWYGEFKCPPSFDGFDVGEPVSIKTRDGRIGNGQVIDAGLAMNVDSIIVRIHGAFSLT